MVWKRDEPSPTGLEPDIAREIAKRLGTKAEFVARPSGMRKPRMEMLEGDLADIVVSTFTINESRKERVDFSIPYFTDGLGVLALPGSGIESSSDLEGKMVIVRSSTTGFEWAKENLESDNVISSVDVEQVVERLLSKKAHAYINDKSSLEAMASRNPGVVVLPMYLTGENWGVAVAKGRPGLLKAINSIIRKMTSDGTLVRFRSKWMKLY